MIEALGVTRPYSTRNRRAHVLYICNSSSYLASLQYVRRRAWLLPPFMKYSRFYSALLPSSPFAVLYTLNLQR